MNTDPNGSQLMPMDPNRFQWVLMDPIVSQCIPINPSGSQWIPMDLQRSQWTFMDPNGSQWVSQDFNGTYWIPMDPNQYKWIQMDLNGWDTTDKLNQGNQGQKNWATRANTISYESLFGLQVQDPCTSSSTSAAGRRSLVYEYSMSVGK